jgi:hypothetical protein
LNWWHELRSRLGRAAAPTGPPLSEEVAARVDAEFAMAERPAVAAQLQRYSARSGASEPVRVQLAILELAKGNPKDVAQYTKAALNDFRDVIYWAYYYDNDPYPPLSDLIDELVDTRKLTAEDAFRIRNEPGVTAYYWILKGLIAELTARRILVTTEQRDTLIRLCRLLKIPQKQLANIRLHPQAEAE